jgi:NADPH:quinone reductase
MTPANEMRAVVIDRFGGPEVLTVSTLPVPEPKPDQILIRVKSAGVGIWDQLEREGAMANMYKIQTKFPLVLGSEGAGKIVDVGEKVSGFQKGDTIYGFIWQRNPKAGFDAEYAAVNAEQAWPIPSNLTLEQASALAIGGATALKGLDDTLHLKPDEKLLVVGASGTVGHMAVQLAIRMGADVFAVASQDDGVALAERLGAEGVVEGHSGDIARSAREYAPDGFDAAFLTVGGEPAEKALIAMAEGGRVAHPVGVKPPKVSSSVKLLPPYIVNKDPENMDRGLMDRLNKLIEAGPFEVHLDEIFSLDRVVDAHRALGSHHVGRLVLRPSN